MYREFPSQHQLAIPVQMDAEIGDASGKGHLRHIRHQLPEIGAGLQVTDEINPGQKSSR